MPTRPVARAAVGLVRDDRWAAAGIPGPAGRGRHLHPVAGRFRRFDVAHRPGREVAGPWAASPGGRTDGHARSRRLASAADQAPQGAAKADRHAAARSFDLPRAGPYVLPDRHQRAVLGLQQRQRHPPLEIERPGDVGAARHRVALRREPLARQVPQGEEAALGAGDPLLKGTFWLTYSMPGWDGTGKTSGSGLLKSTSGKPEGPYQDMQPGERLGDEIDASLFEDDDGTMYFLWHSGKIARLKPDMSGLAEPYHWLRTTTADPDPKHHSGLCAGFSARARSTTSATKACSCSRPTAATISACSENFDGRYSCCRGHARRTSTVPTATATKPFPTAATTRSSRTTRAMVVDIFRPALAGAGGDPADNYRSPGPHSPEGRRSDRTGRSPATLTAS